MKKKKIMILISIFSVLSIFFILHSTPSIALRTHLFMTGNPIVSLTTEIVDDKIHNEVDKQILENQNAKCYSLTNAAFEKATESKLTNFKVSKKGFLFFAQYYGEV